ncbi:MAG: Gfo/Idh/MocA family oxidoreductase, partial [Bacteroidales bacterium]|nr:Gfo/Idh/MocA family oxidoreductase [Bacteroidales bacterium]
AGHLGRIHLKCIKAIPEYTLVGFYDPDEEKAREAVKEFGVPAFPSIDALIDAVEVVDIVTPTLSHFDCANQALRAFRHVFIEKPVVATPDQALELIKIAGEAGVKVQVGHVERFNPAFMVAAPYISKPMFIEAHRLAQFNPRGTDVPVVLDLMIHDIDIVLSVVRSNVRRIHASGVSIVSDTPDIANARIEFENGSVANLTASRISLKNMRKCRFFQRDAYIAVDFLDKKVEVVTMQDIDPATADPFALVLELGEGKGSRQISIQNPEVKPVNAIQTELERFAEAIMNNTSPAVTIDDGYAALDIAHRILEKMGHS